jgi:hypothetical protein
VVELKKNKLDGMEIEVDFGEVEELTGRVGRRAG